MEKLVLIPYDKYQRLIQSTKSPTTKSIHPPPGKREEVQKHTKKDNPHRANNNEQHTSSKQTVKWISF